MMTHPLALHQRWGLRLAGFSRWCRPARWGSAPATGGA